MSSLIQQLINKYCPPSTQQQQSPENWVLVSAQRTIPTGSTSEKKMTDRIVTKKDCDREKLRWIEFALSGKMKEGPTRPLTKRDIDSSLRGTQAPPWHEKKSFS